MYIYDISSHKFHIIYIILYLQHTILLLTKNIYDSYDIDNVTNETPEAQKLFSISIRWRCYMGAGDCLVDAGQLMKDLKENREPVASGIRDAIYCAGNDHDMTFLFLLQNQLTANTTNDEERRDIISALGCRNSLIISKMLDALRGPMFNRNENKIVLSSLLANHRQGGAQFILDHMKTESLPVTTSEMASILWDISGKMNNEEDLEAVIFFYIRIYA